MPTRVGPQFSHTPLSQASTHSPLALTTILGPTGAAQPTSCPITTFDQVHASSASSQIHVESSISDLPLLSQPSASSHVDFSSHPMTTLSKNHISKPKSFTDGTVRYPLSHALLVDGVDVNVLVEPTCYTSAMKHPIWRAAINLEFDALLKN